LSGIPNTRGDSVILVNPGHTAVDTLAVDLQPTTHVPQALLENGQDSTILGGSHIDEHIAIAADGGDDLWKVEDIEYKYFFLIIAPTFDDILGGHEIGQGDIESLTPAGAIQGEGIFPLVSLQNAGIEAVGTVVEIAVHAGGAKAPAIIGHHRVPHWTVVVQPGNELLGTPVLGRSLPVAIGPDDLRQILLHQLHLLRTHLALHKVLLHQQVQLVVGPQRVEPLEQGVVEPELQTRLLPNGGSKFLWGEE